MPTQTFTSGNDTFLVHTAGTFDLDFLEGDDTLTVQGGTSTTAHMGLGNDIVQLKSGLATVFGDAGADRFEIYAANAILDGGDDNDLINIRGGSGISASGGLGDDRFNIYAGSLSLTLHGGDGDDDFFGYFHPVTGTIYGDAGNDYFVQFVGGVSIYGGTGNDIYRADATNPAAFVELSGEGIDSVQVARGASYTLPDNIENISVQGFHGSVLTAATLTGNALNNTINGHNNIETVVGLAGDDRLFAKGGDDTVWGGEGNDYLDGGPGNDTLNGEAGNDTINGRTGNDTMAGGTGDDTYYVDSLSDVVTENSGEGTDLVRVAISGYTLTDNVENGTVFGSAGISMSGNILDNLLTGGAGGDVLHAGSGNDTVKGGAGNDQLYGEAGDDILNGGAGDDSMFGGIGNDTYYVDSLSDSIVENDLQGSDSAYVTVSGYTLAANVESGFVGVTTALTLSGNAIGNHLTGNAGDDVLHGGDGADTLDGGTGADTMDGGLGDDTYYVDNPGDVVEEGIGDPPWSNTVYSAIVYYDLPDYVSFGYVTLTTGATLIGGNGFYALAGNLGDDTLTGGNLLYGMEGNDTLTGTSLDDNIDGGSGADTMTGGIGDDSYTVDNSADQIVENPGEGTYDTVYSFAADYTLSANVEYGDIEIESATLHGNGSANQLLGKTGGGNDVLDGLGGDDTLGGDAGNDTLYGGDGNDRLIGGLGADQMWGGAGNDTFFYASASYSTVAAPDMINDFTSGSDKIDVSGAYSGTFTWTLFPSGTAGQWWFSADASTPNLYHLFFDVDGGGADMKIDVLTTGGGIATTDIIG